MSEPTRLPFDPIAKAAQSWADTWGDSTRMQMATSIMRAQQILLATYDEALRPYGITFARFEALVLLKFSKTGALPMKIIGDRLQVHATSVTNTVDRLTAAGLVDRQRNPRDGRGILAVITPEGRGVVDRAAVVLQRIDFALTDLLDTDVSRVTEVLGRLRSANGDFDAEL